MRKLDRSFRQAATLVQSLEYDADGNLASAWAAGDMNCDGVVDFSDVDAFLLAETSREEYEAAYPDCNWLNADCNGDGTVDFGDIDAFTALLTSGNTAPAQTLVWDGENRLAEWRPTFPANTPGAQKVTCSYDYQGRRVEKKRYNWVNGQWQTTPSLHRKFVWDGPALDTPVAARRPARQALAEPGSVRRVKGAKLLLELNGLSEDAVVRKYTWGLDLAGQMGGAGVPAGLEAAGGTLDNAALRQGQVGGLLAVEQPQTVGDPLRYVYLYDANGNVGQVIDLSAASATAALKAKYEYDPYGRRTSLAPFEYDQPFRFSTKYFDAETGFLYFGGRYYQPSLGRWLNRDPIEEAGGLNLYAFAGNDPIDRFDPLGYVCGPNPEDCGSPGGASDSGPWACPTDGEVPSPAPVLEFHLGDPDKVPTPQPGHPCDTPAKDKSDWVWGAEQAGCWVKVKTPAGKTILVPGLKSRPVPLLCIESKRGNNVYAYAPSPPAPAPGKWGPCLPIGKY